MSTQAQNETKRMKEAFDERYGHDTWEKMPRERLEFTYAWKSGYSEKVKWAIIEDKIPETKRTNIQLNPAELQSNSSRIKWAEGLILQLPWNHEGKNSWLMNYGQSEVAITIRKALVDSKYVWDEKTESIQLITSRREN